MATNLIIYHKNCFDGATAAAVAFKGLGVDKAELFASDYGDLPPIKLIREGTYKNIYIVDFSYPVDILNQMADMVEKLVVLDHHETPIKAIEEALANNVELRPNIDCRLVRGLGGCHLAAEYFGIKSWMVDRVARADVVDYSLPGTKELNAYLKTVTINPLFFLEDLEKMDDPDYQQGVIRIGELILKGKENDAKWHLENALRFVEFEGELVGLINVPKYLATDVSLAFLEGNVTIPYVICYHDEESSRVFRFTSRKGSDVDVESIAANYGGGGHFNCAGLKVPRGTKANPNSEKEGWLLTL